MLAFAVLLFATANGKNLYCYFDKTKKKKKKMKKVARVLQVSVTSSFFNRIERLR